MEIQIVDVFVFHFFLFLSYEYKGKSFEHEHFVTLFLHPFKAWNSEVGIEVMWNSVNDSYVV